MNGGRISGFFNSIFGELLLDRDCTSILEDPNADPMDKDICRTFKQFNFDFPSVDIEVDDGNQGQQSKEDPQSLRDSIFKKPSPRQSERSEPRGRHKASGRDQDLDSQVAKGVDPSTLIDSIPDQPTSKSFSSYTKVTITQRPDGTVEERRCHRDSHGNEEETTIIRDPPIARKGSIRNKLSDWVWPSR